VRVAATVVIKTMNTAITMTGIQSLVEIESDFIIGACLGLCC
jgi:hypothetical protein